VVTPNYTWNILSESTLSVKGCVTVNVQIIVGSAGLLCLITTV